MIRPDREKADLGPDEPAYWRPLDEQGRRRVHQVKRWLEVNFPTPFPVVLRLERISPRHCCVGETYRLGGRVVIRIDPRACTAWAVETLVHEWAHAFIWPASMREQERQVRIGHPEHCEAWNAVHGKMLAAFYDQDGMDDSWEC